MTLHYSDTGKEDMENDHYYQYIKKHTATQMLLNLRMKCHCVEHKVNCVNIFANNKKGDLAKTLGENSSFMTNVISDHDKKQRFIHPSS